MRSRALKILCACACVCLCLVSCAREKYADDKPCANVSAAATKELNDGLEYTEFDASHREFYFKDSTLYDDCSLVYSTDTNDINEIGVFHAVNEKAAKYLEAECLDYIDELREDERAFIASYAPEELPKLDGAKVYRFGNYVVYTVLPTDKTYDVLDQIEKILMK